MIGTDTLLPDLVPFDRRTFYRDRVLAALLCLGLTGLVGLHAIELDRRGGQGLAETYVAEVLTGRYKWEYRPAFLQPAQSAQPASDDPVAANLADGEVGAAAAEVDPRLLPYTGYLNRLTVALGTGGAGGVEHAALTAANGARVSSATFVRSGPSRNHGSVGTLPAGTSVSILETDRGWHRVDSGSVTGWVWEGMLSDISVAAVRDMPRLPHRSLVGVSGLISRQIGLRAEPAGDIIKVLPVLTEFVVSSHGEPNADWLPVNVAGTTGWVYRGLVRLLG